LPKLAETLGYTLDEFRKEFGVPPAQARPGKPTPKNISTSMGLPHGLKLHVMQPARILPEFEMGVAASRRVDKIAEQPDTNRLVGTPDRRAFVTPVDGDCQEPKWKHGELVIFSYDAVDREGLLPGRSYYLVFTDGSTTFKRVFADERDPEKFILRCWNQKKYPKDQPVHRDEVVRIARAIAKQIIVDEETEE
jgi:hypothetical protein